MLQPTGVVIIAFLVLVVEILSTCAERKVVARLQGRIPQTRVGVFGVLQGIADAIKVMTKGDITPFRADRCGGSSSLHSTSHSDTNSGDGL